MQGIRHGKKLYPAWLTVAGNNTIPLMRASKAVLITESISACFALPWC